MLGGEAAEGGEGRRTSTPSDVQGRPRVSGWVECSWLPLPGPRPPGLLRPGLAGIPGASGTPVTAWMCSSSGEVTDPGEPRFVAGKIEPLPGSVCPVGNLG